MPQPLPLRILVVFCAFVIVYISIQQAQWKESWHQNTEPRNHTTGTYRCTCDVVITSCVRAYFPKSVKDNRNNCIREHYIRFLRKFVNKRTVANMFCRYTCKLTYSNAFIAHFEYY